GGTAKSRAIRLTCTPDSTPTPTPTSATPTPTARWHREGLGEEPDPRASQIVRLACEGLWDVASHDPELNTEDDLQALETRMKALLKPPS
ncbi:TetR/AcrR family transcriptional regulator, partial [Nonomuraea angiospora]